VSPLFDARDAHFGCFFYLVFHECDQRRNHNDNWVFIDQKMLWVRFGLASMLTQSGFTAKFYKCNFYWQKASQSKKQDM